MKMLSTLTDFEESPFACSLPPESSTFSASNPFNGLAASFSANSKSFAVIACAAPCTADPTLAVVHDPDTKRLAVIEVEALVDGAFEVAIDKDVLNFLTEDGKNFAIKVQ